MRYRCDNVRCPAKFPAVIGGEPEKPRFREVRLATYEVDEDGDTMDLLDWDNQDRIPVVCDYCGKPAKVMK